MRLDERATEVRTRFYEIDFQEKNSPGIE